MKQNEDKVTQQLKGAHQNARAEQVAVMQRLLSESSFPVSSDSCDDLLTNKKRPDDMTSLCTCYSNHMLKKKHIIYMSKCIKMFTFFPAAVRIKNNYNSGFSSFPSSFLYGFLGLFDRLSDSETRWPLVSHPYKLESVKKKNFP